MGIKKCIAFVAPRIFPREFNSTVYKGHSTVPGKIRGTDIESGDSDLLKFTYVRVCEAK